MSPALDLGDLDLFTVGTEGPTGRRVFLLQCRSGATVLTLKVEKQQVSVLAEYLGRPAVGPGATGRAPRAISSWWNRRSPTGWSGTLGVSYDDAMDRIVLVAEELVAEDEEGDVARFTVTREQAAAFAVRATLLVEAGRPPCPLCGSTARPDRTPVPADERPPATAVVTLLAEGEIEVVGRMPWSSNQTFLVTCTSGTEETGAVYKPERGERHLWDFPGGIFRREIAAYRAVGRPRLGPGPRDDLEVPTPLSGKGRSSGSSTPTSRSTTSP